MILAAIFIVVNGAKGISAVQLSRTIGCDYKTAFVLAHKLREAMASEYEGVTLDGEVHADGLYVGGKIRPANLKKNRRDRRLAQNQNGQRRVVVVARQFHGNRTLTTVVRAEADGIEFVKSRVAEGAEVYADEASHWDDLHAHYKVWRVNHSEFYSFDGRHTNYAESFFSRLRNMFRGTHHHVSPDRVHAYACHAAWLEDHRDQDNYSLIRSLLGLTLTTPVTRTWKGYWQRRRI